MIIYGAVFIPIILIVAAVVLWRKTFVLWEPAIPVVVAVLLVIFSKGCIEQMACTDIEYWGGWVTEANYMEAWDEEIPCTHVKYKTVTDSKGNSTQVPDGYEHAYDVDYHAPYWFLNDSNGAEISLSEAEYKELKGKFGNEQFIDHHRSYHLIDGDQYKTVSKGVIVPTVTKHTYENRIQASSSVYKTRKLTKEEKKRIFEYPPFVNSYFAPSLLGWQEGSIALAKMNALLGAQKQVRAMILVFKGQGADVAKLQQDYWLNGNKNEFVTCIGMAADNTLAWVDTFCWENEQLKVNARNFLAAKIGSSISIKDYVAWLEPAIQNEWQRKQFKDFSYLSVEPPWYIIFLVYLSVAAVSVGIIYWEVGNAFTEDDPQGKRAIRRRY